MELGHLARDGGLPIAEDGQGILEQVRQPMRRLVEDERGLDLGDGAERLAPVGAAPPKKAKEVEGVGRQAAGDERGQNGRSTRHRHDSVSGVERGAHELLAGIGYGRRARIRHERDVAALERCQDLVDA